MSAEVAGDVVGFGGERGGVEAGEGLQEHLTAVQAPGGGGAPADERDGAEDAVGGDEGGVGAEEGLAGAPTEQEGVEGAEQAWRGQYGARGDRGGSPGE